MKFFILPTLIFAASILAVAPAFAQTSNVTATVRPSPLAVEISAPSSVEVGDWFDIEVTITNKGTEFITKTFAKIHTSSDLKLKTRGKKKRIGTLQGGEIKLIWQAKANTAGNYVITVEVEGFLGDEKITASDTDIIEVTGFIGLSFWVRFLFGL